MSTAAPALPASTETLALDPAQAWDIFRSGRAELVDVRTGEERVFVGRVPGSLHVPWALGPAMLPNPDFVSELRRLVPPAIPLILLCRSGLRSAAAAQTLLAGGWHWVATVAHGFEGPLDAHQQRGRLGGWRQSGLPWVQD